MQLTRFDRWLREKFVNEIHVYSLRPPVELPRGVRSEELPERAGQRFKFHYRTYSSKVADRLIEQFKTHNQMFTTRVKDRKGWWVRFVAPVGKSVTWWCLWMVISVIGVIGVSQTVRNLWNNPEVRQNILESVEIMKG